MTPVLAHLLAAYTVLAAPWLGWMWYQRARKRIASGAPDAKRRLYRSLVGEQITTVAVFLVLWGGGRVPAASFGLAPPRSWAVTTAALFILVGVLAWSGLRLRPKADKLRKRLQDSIGLLIPESRSERLWWGAVSVGAGISEELLFRGFLLYYFSVYLPSLNTLEKVFLTSLVFGLGHVYQGWRGVLGTGIAGFIFAGLYLSTGSLLLPVVIHAATDYRALLIFPPATSPMVVAEGNA
jgi:uncharacterized protein